MENTFLEDFSASFDDGDYPHDFLQTYELMECFSHNEMGETFLVKDRQTGVDYVAKCYFGKSFLSRTTESDLLRKLNHAGLPAYIGEYQNENMLCIVRSFAHGKSLDQWVQENPLDRAQSIAIAVQLCEILEYLHEQTPPIIHRDIKPQNIIINEEGSITLIDFGISRTYDEQSQEDTICLGTRHYAAPEQYGFYQTDSRSDIFSLGVLLCWMLTHNVDVQQAIPAMPDRWLANIVSKCTAFDPQNRYQNAVQVKNALTGRITRRKMLALMGVSVFAVAGGLHLANIAKIIDLQPSGLKFREPLIEQAVRLTLQKNEKDEISEQDLLSITALYVFGDKAAANEGSFHLYGNSFANSEGKVSRGTIQKLEDLSKLKNLRSISLAYQNITDLTPMSAYTALEFIDLRHNPFDDVTPLAKITELASFCIFDTLVSDLTALRSCSHLSIVDAGFTQIVSMDAFKGLDSLSILVMRKAPLQSIDQIESHPLLEEVYLSQTRVRDLSPLLNLPRLRVVEVDESMRTAAEAIAAEAHFKINYQ